MQNLTQSGICLYASTNVIGVFNSRQKRLAEYANVRSV